MKSRTQTCRRLLPSAVLAVPPSFHQARHTDGTHIYFNGLQRDNNDLWAVTLEGGRERRLTRFSQRAGSIGQYALAVDREHLYFAWRTDVGDIWVIDVMHDEE